MASTISPNMGLIVPTVSVEPGPTWASDINASLSILDGHNHAPGSGVQINPAGLDINSDLPFNGNDAISLRSVRFNAQSSPLTGTSPDLGCLYESGVDLYYNDGSGNQVRITSGGSVNAGAGSIGGLPSGTASVTYSGGTYVFQSATNTSAVIDGGSFILRNNTALSKGLTLSPPNAMAANYTITFPTVPASGISFVTMDSSGNEYTNAQPDGSTIEFSGNLLRVPTGGITSTQLASGAVIASKIGTGEVTAVKLAAGVADITSTTITSTGPWTAPAGVTTVIVKGRAGSGGGGSGGNGGAGGGGGGGGAVTSTVILTVVPTTVYTITIGAAGVGGAGINSPGTGNAGTSGTDTTFGSLWTFKGASGGAAGGNTILGVGGSGRLANGGDGSPSSGATSAVPGFNSLYANGGAIANGSAGAGGGGGAGDGIGGAGGAGGASATSGGNGTSGGGGGGGGGETTNGVFSGSGGDGTAGYVTVAYSVGSPN